MTPLMVLGARLVRAGGLLRVWSVTGGCAVAVLVLTTAWAMPDALYPVLDPTLVDPRRQPLVTLLESLTVPVLALVLTVGRLSSQVRDRRLASLRLLGVSRRQAAVVAVVENAIPAAAGGVLGVLGFFGLSGLLARVLRDQLQAPISLAPVRLAAVVLAVIALSVALALAPLGRIGEPRTAHAAAAIRRPSKWRVAPLVPSVAAFVTLGALPVGRYQDLIAPLFLTAVVCGGLSVALLAPAVPFQAATGLVRSGRIVLALAGRGIQTQAAPIGRRVVALGLAVYVVVGGAGLLGVYENTLYLKAAIHQIEVGPQQIFLTSADADLLHEIARADGVRAIVPSYQLAITGCDPGGLRPNCPAVFVGTCQTLSAVMVVTGCQDDQAAWIDADLRGYEDYFAPPAPTESLALADATGATHTIGLSHTMTQDVQATTARWVWPADEQVFVPLAVAQQWGLQPTNATVIADAGSQVRERLSDIAASNGGEAYNPYVYDYQQVVSTRAAAWAAIAVGIGVALLTYGLTTVDDARANRRPRARLVALGVPASLLRRVDAIQTLLPLVTTVVLATALGLAATSALSHTADQPFAIAPKIAVALLSAVAVGATLITAATLPLTRATIRASDLREE